MAEIILGIGEGLKKESAVNLDHVQTVAQEMLRHYVGSLSGEKMAAVCRGLAIAVACDPHGE